MSSLYHTVFPYIIFVFLFARVASESDEVIGFPESIDDDAKRPADNREPLFMPNTCPNNELLYPGDQLDDWICDCKPAYIYYPKNEECYAAFEKGPCEENEYLAMPEKGFVPICIPNVCRNGRVPRINKKNKTKCVKLGEPCDINTQRRYGVNSTTLKVECLKAPGVVTRFGDMEEGVSQPTTETIKQPVTAGTTTSRPLKPKPGTPTGPPVCYPGCKRIHIGRCPQLAVTPSPIVGY